MKLRCFLTGHSWLDSIGKIKFLGDFYLVKPCLYCNEALLEPLK